MKFEVTWQENGMRYLQAFEARDVALTFAGALLVWRGASPTATIKETRRVPDQRFTTGCTCRPCMEKQAIVTFEVL